MTCSEATPDHNKGMDTDTIEATQGNPIQHTKATAAEPAVTHHTSCTTDNPHTTAHPVTGLKTTVGNIHVHSIPQRITQFKIILQPGDPKITP